MAITRRTALSWLGATTAAALAAGHVPRALAAEAWPGAIRIGIQKGDPLVALRASGKLEAALRPHGVAVKWIEFVYGAPMVEAINSGDVDVGVVGSPPPILAQAGAAPSVVYVAAGSRYQNGYAIVVPANSTVRTISDLRGKKIAFAKGSQGHLFVLRALADAGVSPSEVQFAYLSYSDARAAIERGFVDAWSVPDPRYADAEIASHVRTILKIGDVSVPQYAFYIGTRTFAEKYPATLRTLFDTLSADITARLAKPDETADLLAQNTGVPLDVWKRAIPRLEWGVQYPITPDVLKAQQANADLAFQTRLIPRAVDVRQAVVDIRKG
ncbi:aliphatic sulfonate ABC transporter substrate-binding protein [Pandoraea sp. PE-S2R-1]|uniref:aliphatic sulfonate ABC transporter substrate-binding protein n=1 Tax=Pandoraea sp. PE-S2R-1 TaxID=1986994 RepID=UPI000B3F9B00|nr:aliphatic sulfonate ABC transporter substrate-binding protein [Pandoraea sp. PE-S2R-1]